MSTSSTMAAAELTRMKCVPCTGETPKMTDREIARLERKVPDWSILEGKDGVKKLHRVFKFKDFADALAFTNKVGQIAESEQHHPAILTGWQSGGDVMDARHKGTIPE
jgi:4a-hydroxytetrahydrobiopterin dehydratase